MQRLDDIWSPLNWASGNHLRTWEVIASYQQMPPVHAVWLLKLLDWSADILRLMKRTQQAGCRFNSLAGALQIITYQEQQKHWTTEVNKRRQGSLQSLSIDLNSLHAQWEMCFDIFVSLIWNWLQEKRLSSFAMWRMSKWCAVPLHLLCWILDLHRHIPSPTWSVQDSLLRSSFSEFSNISQWISIIEYHSTWLTGRHNS